MKKLKPCPFCGGEAEIHEVVFGNGYNKSGIIPADASLVKTKTALNGSTIYYWERSGYQVHCTTTKCICRSGTSKYLTEKEAIDVWNTRHRRMKDTDE